MLERMDRVRVLFDKRQTWADDWRLALRRQGQRVDDLQRGRHCTAAFEVWSNRRIDLRREQFPGNDHDWKVLPQTRQGYLAQFDSERLVIVADPNDLPPDADPFRARFAGTSTPEGAYLKRLDTIRAGGVASNAPSLWEQQTALEIEQAAAEIDRIRRDQAMHPKIVCDDNTAELLAIQTDWYNDHSL